LTLKFENFAQNVTESDHLNSSLAQFSRSTVRMRTDAGNYCCDRCADGEGATSKASPVPPNPGVKTRILFVDDEPSMLRVLKMGMRSMAAAWEMEFASSGEEALIMVKQSPFDVVVTDMRMSGINGAQLLNEVLRLHPRTVRIVLSGYSDLSEVVGCIGLTHQFLEKPCSLDDLKNCLTRVCQLNARLANERLRTVAASLKNLPSLPELYLEIADAVQSPNCSTQLIAEIASQDPAIAAKLLQLSNSAYFGFSRKVFSIAEAVQLLGVGIVQSLALAVPIFTSFSRQKCPDFPIDQVWEHSLQTGIISRRICSDHLADSSLGEQAFCAGLLHDLGKIILADSLPAEYGDVLKESRDMHLPLREAERKCFAATHAEVGAYLLAIWGLPIPLVEAVANHHCPQRCGTREFCLAGIVHIANALQHATAAQPESEPDTLDADYVKFVGLEHQFQVWRAELSGQAPGE
jgi:HD-like signal output (HDOD) protein